MRRPYGGERGASPNGVPHFEGDFVYRVPGTNTGTRGRRLAPPQEKDMPEKLTSGSSRSWSRASRRPFIEGETCGRSPWKRLEVGCETTANC
jgi:hypothetical protein